MLLNIDAQEGVNLDHIGEIVSLSRTEAHEFIVTNEEFEMTDELYRKMLRYKILLNNSNATYYDIMEGVSIIWDTDNVIYREDPSRPATIFLDLKTVNVPATVGEYAGFKMAVSFDSFNHKFVMNLKGQLSHNLEIGSDPLGNIARINHALESMPKQLDESRTKLETVERQLETAKAEVTKPFAQEAELAEKLERLSALNALLNMDEKGDDAIGMDDAPEEGNGGKETSGHDVQKSGQEEKISDKAETGEKVADGPALYPVQIADNNYTAGSGSPQGLKPAAAMADKPVQRASLREKLEAFKVRAAGGDAEKAMPKKARDKAETL